MHGAALLLMTVCAAGDPVVSTPDCPDGSCIVEPKVKPTTRDRLHYGLKKQDCGHHIHCPYPGVIPNTEHDTLCQRIKDWMFPNKAWSPSKKEEAKVEEHARIMLTGTPVTRTSGPVYQLISRMRWGERPEILYSMPGVAVAGSTLMTGKEPPFGSTEEAQSEEAVVTVPGEEMMPMPQVSPVTMPVQMIPTVPKKVGREKIKVMPIRSPWAARPAKFSEPRPLELGPNLND